MSDFKVTELDEQIDFGNLPYWLNEKRLRDQKIALIGDKIVQAAIKQQARRP